MLRRPLTLSLSLLTLVLLGMVSAQVLQGQRAEAQSNQPPVIQPIGDKTLQEGETLVIPFTAAGANPNVSDANNDRIDYFVEGIVGGAAQPLPSWATYVIDPKTAEGKVILRPGLNDAGTYQLRFRAVDDKGASSEKSITVAVQNRSGAPAIKVTKTYPMVDYYESLKKPLAVDPIVIEESSADWFSLLVEAFDPEGEAVSVDFAGIPKAEVIPQGPGSYLWRWYPDYFPASRANVGLYSGQITATDASGNKTVVNQILEVRRRWNHQSEMVYVRPEARQGGIRTIGIRSADDQTGFRTSIVRGGITFGLESTRLWDYGPFPFPAEVRYRYVLHTPDANGNDLKTYLSDVLTGPQEIIWDSATLPDGTYAVDIEFINGGATPESEINRFRARPLFIIVDNTPGSLTGPQWLPGTGFPGTVDAWHESTAIYWLRFSGAQEQAGIHPYPYRIIPPPQTDTDRQTIATKNEWFVETWLKPWNARYYPDPGFFRTSEGHLVFGGIWWNGSHEAGLSELFPETDGGRNQVSLANQTSLRPDPSGPGFLGIGFDGRLVRIDPSNKAKVLKTIAGWVTRSDAVPFLPWDETVSLTQRRAEQKQLVGSFENGVLFKYSYDLAIDPQNPNLIYIADTGNHRIALVDRSGPQAVITTFAGKAGEAAYANGSRLDARFKDPTSIEIVGRTLYIVDRGNFALRAVDLETGQVTTPVGKGPSAPAVPDQDTVRSNLDAWTFPSVTFDEAAMVYPLWIRRYSNGDLLLVEAAYPGKWPAGGNLRRMRFAEQRVDQLNDATGTPIRTVVGGLALPDWQGNIGPADDVLTSGVKDNAFIFRISSNGSVTRVMTDYAAELYPAGDTPFAKGTVGAYPVHAGLTIDDQEARFAFTGQQQNGLVILRPFEARDPTIIDPALVAYGRDLYLAGTNLEFFPSASRPSLASLHGRMGFNRFGNVPQFDDLASMSDADLAAYIRGGMGGKIPRPELTGRDLQAMIYFIRVQSLQGKIENIDRNQIAANLQAAGYWDDLNDTRLPEIRSLQTFTADNTARLVFQTDEPTICMVKYGPTDYYGVNSPIENSYQKDHDLTINTQLPKITIDKHHFTLLCKDQAGNLTRTKDKLMTGAEVPPPPRVNRAPSVSAGADQMITLPSSATLDGTVSDDGLPDPPKKVTFSWSKVSGPETVTFGNAAKEDTTAAFSIAGTYVLRLTGNDSLLSTSDDVQVTVRASSTPELCLTPRPENRVRLGTQDFSGLATTLTITDPQGLIVYSGIHTPTNKEGDIRITDPTILAKINDTTLYTITAHPESHRRRKMTLLGSALKAAPCDPFPGSPFGFLDESGLVTIQHLVRLIAHYRTQADAQVNRAFLNQKFLLRDLISVIKLYVSNVRHE